MSDAAQVEPASRAPGEAGRLRRTLATRLMRLLRVRVERALAALDARDREATRDLMVLQLPFWSLENDAWLLRSWNRTTALSIRATSRAAQPFVDVIPPRQSIDQVRGGPSARRSPLDALGSEPHPGSGHALSREELERAHQQFLQSLPPRELTLFAACPRHRRNADRQ